MKRWHIFLILGYIIFPILILKLSNLIIPFGYSYIELYGITYCIILLVCLMLACSLPAFCFANLIEKLWCEIFNTTNYYDL